MKRFLLLLSVFWLSFDGFAQPDAIYTQYMYNQFVFNPAYAGSRNSMSLLFMHRTKWTQFQGSPSTSTLSFQSPLYKSNLAWGINMASDRIGPVINTLAGITGAYHVKMKKSRLAFGLRAGFYSRTLDGNKLDFRNSADPLLFEARQSASSPSLDFGLYYYTRKFFASMSINHLGGGLLKYNSLPDATFNLRRFSTLGLGYAIEVNENLVIKPSLLLKASDGFQANLDVNVNTLFYKKVWFGLSLRNQTNVNLLLDVNVTDFMRIGYSYDIFINSLNKATNGAHEVFIGFDFNPKKDFKTVSPRYL